MTNDLITFLHNYLDLLWTLAHAPFIVFLFVITLGGTLVTVWLDKDLEDLGQ